MQFCLWLTKLEEWDFFNYDPRFLSKMLCGKTFHPDRKLFDRFENEVPIFIEDMDKALCVAGAEWGSQWRHLL